MSELERGQSRRLGMAVQNRSLERGIAVLRAFRPGVDLLGNSELAERTGLPRATISRLTQTLTSVGMLDYCRSARAYRLAAPVLSLAHAMRSASPVLKISYPSMRVLSQELGVNVGLAAADQYDMVYLESIRHSQQQSLRSIVAGQRVPIALTTLGRAYLAVLPQEQRAELYTYFASHLGHWDTLREEIDQAIEHVHEHGFCQASWQPGIVALATPLVLPEHRVYALNISTNRNLSDQRWIGRLAKQLLELRAQIKSL